MKKIAVIDIGSNSVRLSIAEVGENFKLIHENSIYARLAEGIDIRNPEIKPVPAMRAAMAISNLAIEAQAMEAEEIYAVATEAVRCANNAQWFVGVVKESTNLEIRVLDYAEEAYYDCVSASYETGLSEFILVDTGGGSTEIAVFKEGNVVHCTSFSWGAVTMTDMFSQGGVVSEENFKKMIEHVSEGISTVDWLSDAVGLPFVMTGGSLKSYGVFSNKYTLEGFALKMREMTPDERGEFGISKRRMDTITAGVVPAMIISAILNPSVSKICQGGVCRGFLLDYEK